MNFKINSWEEEKFISTLAITNENNIKTKKKLSEKLNSSKDLYFSDPNSNNENIQQFKTNNERVSEREISLGETNSQLIKSKSLKNKVTVFPENLTQPTQYNRMNSLFSQIEKKKKNKNKNKIENEMLFRAFFSVSNTMILIKKFIQKMRTQIGIRNPNLLTKETVEIINDWSFFYNPYNKLNLFQRIKQFCKNYSFNTKFLPKIFDPSKYQRMIWDICKMFFSTLMFFIIPLDLSFEVNILNMNGIILPKIFIAIFFFLNILINLNTAFFEKGKLTFSRNLITINYLKNDFLIDSLTLYPFLHSFQYRSFIDLIFFLRILKFFSLINKLEQYLFANEKLLNYINLLKLIFNVLLLSHICACMWYWIGISSNNSTENSWIKNYKIEDLSPSERYLNAYHYIVITMITVGYGKNLLLLKIIKINYFKKHY